MAKIKRDPKPREAIQKFIKLYQPESVDDIYELMRDLKEFYKASSEEVALKNLDTFDQKWSGTYPSCVNVNSWRNNWVDLSAYFKYPEGIRTIIYTTNVMENFNRQLRKVTKSKSVLSTDAALMKSLYLSMLDSTSKWTSRVRKWDYILNHLSIYFEGRIEP